MAEDAFDNSLYIKNATRNGYGKIFQMANERNDLYFWGTFAGATVKLQVSPDRKEWFDVADFTKTAKAVILGVSNSNSFARWVVENAGVNTNVSAAFV